MPIHTEEQHLTSLRNRLAEQSMPAPPSACILWLGGIFADGYGKVKFRGRNMRAHRAAYFLNRGHWPEHQLRHLCDTPLCIAVSHLVPGTPADNSRDMVTRGRSVRGENSPHAKLTATQVNEICAASGTCQEIAERFGVSTGTIWRIRTCRHWKHLPVVQSMPKKLGQRTKLTATQVAEIRASTEFQEVIAQRFGVSQTLISMIRLRQAWKHVP